MARSKMSSMDRVLLFATALMALAMATELVAAQAEGSAAAPGPSEDCTSTLINLSPCLDYVSANDTNPPPKNCCTGLAQVVNENEICLCQLFAKTNPFGLTINQTRAEAMPTLCKVETPPLSTCTFLGIPVSAPTSSSPGESPAGSDGSETAPSSNHLTSGTAGNFVPFVGVFTALVIAAFAI